MIARDAVAVCILSPTEIEIRWDSTDFGVVESYKVLHKPASAEDDEYHSISLDGETTFCVIPDLSGNTAYHIKMEADGTDNSEIKTDVVEVTTFKQGTSIQQQNNIRLRVMVFNATFNNISIISTRSVLLVEETGVPRKKTTDLLQITDQLHHIVLY